MLYRIAIENIVADLKGARKKLANDLWARKAQAEREERNNYLHNYENIILFLALVGNVLVFCLIKGKVELRRRLGASNGKSIP